MSDTATKEAPADTASTAASVPKPARAGLDERLANVKVPVTIVIGQKEVALNELSNWRSDTLVSLDQAADEPLEIHVNGTCVARGELCENTGEDGSLSVRILDLVETAS